MSFEQDVEFYATYLANRQNRTVTEHDRELVCSLLKEIVLNGRLLPPGGITTIEYGLHNTKMTRRGFPVYIGTTEWARTHSTHERRRTVWIGEGRNEDWARYVTAWEERAQEQVGQQNEQ